MTRYLVVDDSPTIRLSMRKILQTLDPDDPDVVEASSGSDAMQEFESAPTDFVFLDINLGQENGDEVLRELLRRKPEARVVLVTSAERQDARVRIAIGEGAFAYLAKPLRRDEVARVLSEAQQESRTTRRVH